MHKPFLMLPLLGLTFLSAVAGSTKLTGFGYTATDGTNVDITKLKGEVVVIDFWATWSAPSRADIPILQAAYKKYHKQGFEILGVSLDEDERTFTSYTDEYNMNWPEDFDGGGTHNSLYVEMHIKSVPTIWLVGKDGTLLSLDPRKDLAAEIDKAMKMPYNGK